MLIQPPSSYRLRNNALRLLSFSVVSLLLLLRFRFSSSASRFFFFLFFFFFFFNVLPQVCCRINCEVGVLDPPSRGRFVSNGRAFRSKATRARNTFLTSPRVSSPPRKTGFATGRAKKAFNEPFDSFGSIALAAERI